MTMIFNKKKDHLYSVSIFIIYMLVCITVSDSLSTLPKHMNLIR